MEPINSAVASKINWTNGIAFIVSIFAVFGIVIPEEWQKLFLEVLAIGTPFLTVILRTWFTAKT